MVLSREEGIAVNIKRGKVICTQQITDQKVVLREPKECEKKKKKDLEVI